MHNPTKTFGPVTGAALAGLGVVFFTAVAQAQVVPLGAAEDFAIISYAGVTNSGLTIINGNIALTPLTTITGFDFSEPPGGGHVNGEVHYNDNLAVLARADAFNTYNALKEMVPTGGINLALDGATFTPGVYKFDTTAGLAVGGTLTLDAGGIDGARFVFQVGSGLTTGVGSTMIVTNPGATGPHIYWQVGTSATVGGGSVFEGNILALESITLGTGAVVDGRLIALTGSVTLLGNTVSIPLGEEGSSDGPTEEELALINDQVSPDELTVMFQMGFSASDLRNTNIQRHLERVRAASGGVSESTYTTGSAGSSKGGLSKGGLTQHTVRSELEAKKRSFFFEGANSSVSVDPSGLAHGYDFDRTGFTAGVDSRLSENFVVGLLGGYAETDADLFSGGSMEAESYNAAVYATYYKDGFYLDGLLGGGLNSYDTRRASVGGFATGDTDGWQLEGMLNTGYDVHRGNWTIGPIAGVAFTRVNIGEFTETGSLTPLIFRDQHQDSLRANLGARIAYSAMLGSVRVTPQLRLAWQHEFLDSTQTMDSQFVQGGPVANTRGPNIDADRLLISAGLTVAFTPTVSLYGFYDGRISSSDFSSNTVSAGVKIDF